MTTQRDVDMLRKIYTRNGLRVIYYTWFSISDDRLNNLNPEQVVPRDINNNYVLLRDYLKNKLTGKHSGKLRELVA